MAAFKNNEICTTNRVVSECLRVDFFLFLTFNSTVSVTFYPFVSVHHDYHIFMYFQRSVNFIE